MPKTPGSITVTQGIRISVHPEFVPAESDAKQRRYVFAYRVTISNESDKRAKLRSRKWIIVDGSGRHHDVEGDGVVGKTPDIGPGEQFQYSSFCPLETEWGTMEGSYLMERENGEKFEAMIGRFFLIAKAQPAPAMSPA